MIKLLYEDNDIIVCIKPSGISSQAEHSLYDDMPSLLMKHLAENGIRSPYIGVIHRLDKPVSGIMVYAKNKKSASALCGQLKSPGFNKRYYAVTLDNIPYAAEDYMHGTYRDYIAQEKFSGGRKFSHAVVSDIVRHGYSEAVLNYKILKTALFPDISDKSLSIADIELVTGRYHQIRAQFAYHGHPIWGDMKYSHENASRGNIFHESISRISKTGACETEFSAPAAPALYAYRLSFMHPSTGKTMDFICDLSSDLLSPVSEIFRLILS